MTAESGYSAPDWGDHEPAGDRPAGPPSSPNHSPSWSSLRVLLIEDSDADATLAVQALRRAGFTVASDRVETRQEFKDSVATAEWDLILCDHELSEFRALEALRMLRDAALDVPFIVLSGTIGEEAAVDALKAGAADVVLKDNLARLGAVTERELQAALHRRHRRAADLARQASEARKSAILDSALDAIITIDHEGHIVEFNHAAERTFGYARADVLGQPMADLVVPPSIRKQHKAGFARYLATGEAPILNQRLELTAIRADGHEFPVELTVVKVALSGPAMFTGYVRDITERERLQRQLHQAQRLESLGQLAGGVAHDFNNLLAVIRNYADFVAAEVDLAVAEGSAAARWTPVRKDIAAVQDAAERAVRLTRQLLAFARREVVRPAAVDLNAVVRDVEGLLRRTIGEDIELRTLLAADLWPVHGDTAQLEQVLLNLAVNARDAMPHGGQLTIETSNQPLDAASGASHPHLSDGRFVRLSVSDTGAGMEQEVVARAFEPFFTTKPVGQGSGLGLATIYGIVTQAGGDVRLSSEPGIGTTFTALLPASGHAPANPEPTVPARPHAGSATVLVVDDEPVISELARRLLLRNGYEPIVATSPEHAAALAGEDDARFDVLLTDVVMPHMSGPQLAARVAVLQPEIRVIYMSGHAQPSLDAAGILAESVLLIEKPFSEAQLVRAVGTALRTA